MRRAKITGISFFLLLSFCFAAKTQAVVLNNKPDDNIWGVNRLIRSMVKDSEGNVYAGGNFTEAIDGADKTGNFIVIDKDSGAPILSDFKSNSDVFAAAEDEDGGVYIGGMFTFISGQKRNCIAHLLADGTLDPDFTPVITGGQGSVRDITIYDGHLYVVGNFTSVNDLERNYMVKMDMAGNVDPTFDPSFNGPVYTLILSGSSFYVSGGFTTVDSSTRNYLAKLNLDGSLDTSFSPSVNAAINMMVLQSSNLYIGGSFTKADSTGSSTGITTHNRLAKLNTAGVIDHTFNPTLNNTVWEVAIYNSNLYAGGDFTSVTGAGTTTAAVRNYFVKMNTSGVLDASFAPNFNNTVWTVMQTADGLYVGGDFTAVNSSPSNRLIKFDNSWNLDPAFSRYLNEEPDFLVFSGQRLYTGGKFTSYVPGASRTNIIKVKPDGNIDEDFNPTFNDEIYGLAVIGSDLYVGGLFTTVASSGTTTTTTHNKLVKMNAAGIVDNAFNPSFGGNILTLAVASSTLYIGGTITSATSAGTTTSVVHNKLARMDTAGIVDHAFNPGFVGNIWSIAFSGSDIYVGGTITSATSAGTTTAVTHNRLAKLNTAGIIDHAFNPSFDNTIYSVAVYDSNIYAGGLFTNIASSGTSATTTHGKLAKLNTAGIVSEAFNPEFSLNVFSMAMSGAEIYVTGNFMVADSVFRDYIAKFDTDGNLDLNFEPSMGGYGANVFVLGDTLYVSNSHTASPFRFSSDVLAPAITLNGASSVSLSRGQSYADAGATALDANFGNLSSSISVDNPVNTSVAGTYLVRYSVSDIAGNTSTATRTVTINADETLPVGANYSPEQLIALGSAGNSLNGNGSSSLQFAINENIPFTTDNPLITLRFNNFNNSLINRLAISPKSDFTGASLIDYVSTYSYDICSGSTSCPDGDYIVYAKYYSAWGQASQPASLKITLKRNAAISSPAPETISPSASATSLPAVMSTALSTRLSGRILLQIESLGEAWYINPSDQRRYYLGRPADAYSLMRELGLGATDKDIKLFLSSAAPRRLAGRILLQVQDKGQAYYINPIDLKLYYLGRPEDAFALMRSKGLGITNGDLEKISAGKLE
ncbi:MAG: immunoglobulin-like domain-containing protein [Patescibacteria group bacterium]|jgi:hypothetical protein